MSVLTHDEGAKQRMLETIRRHGLDPSEMIATTEDEQGYEARVTIDDEQIKSGVISFHPHADAISGRLEGDVIIEKRRWPSPEAGLEIRDAINAYYRSTYAAPPRDDVARIEASIRLGIAMEQEWDGPSIKEGTLTDEQIGWLAAWLAGDGVVKP